MPQNLTDDRQQTITCANVDTYQMNSFAWIWLKILIFQIMPSPGEKFQLEWESAAVFIDSACWDIKWNRAWNNSHYQYRDQIQFRPWNIQKV